MEEQPVSERRALEGEEGESEGGGEGGEGGGGGTGWGTGETGDWIQEKSHMLDEVNQLVELMSAEKNSLQEKISSLEVEVDQYHRRSQEVQEGMRRREEDISKMKLEHSALEDKHTIEQQTLQRALHETRKQLISVQKEFELLTESFDQERRCHSKAKTKLEILETQHKTLSQTLKQNNMENEKLKAEVSSLQEQANGYRSEKEALQSQLEAGKRRERKLRDEVLALKGRLSSCRKAQEQLQVHCCALERAVQSSASAPVAMTTRRSKEEARLAKECRKKDELLSSYLQEISTCHDEHRRIQDEMIQIQRRLSQEQAEKKSLSNQLEESIKKNYQLQQQLQEAEQRIHFREQQDGKASSLRSALEEKVGEVSRQLELSQSEHDRLREEVAGREKREREERRRRVRERQRNEAVVKESREAVEQLQRELEATRGKHKAEMEALDKQWRQRMREAQDDYERLKEASMRRCVELAKEVWQLKSSLESSHHQQ